MGRVDPHSTVYAIGMIAMSKVGRAAEVRPLGDAAPDQHRESPDLSQTVTAPSGARFRSDSVQSRGALPIPAGKRHQARHAISGRKAHHLNGARNAVVSHAAAAVGRSSRIRPVIPARVMRSIWQPLPTAITHLSSSVSNQREHCASMICRASSSVTGESRGL